MWKKFFGATLGLFLALCISTAAFNFAVDPYCIWQSERTIGFNFFADAAQNHERLFKAIELINRKPNVVVLGNSKADFAIDPNVFGTHSYNAAVRNAQPLELLAFVDAAIRINPALEKIIIAVDYEMFAYDAESMPGFDPEQLQADRITLKNFFKTLLSFDALRAGFHCVEFNRIFDRDFQSYEPSGKFSEPALCELFTFENSFSRNSLAMKNWSPIDPKLRAEKFDTFAKIVRLCRERNVELGVLIMPVHPIHRAAYPQADYDRWQKKLTSLAPVRDFGSIYKFDNTIDNDKNFWDAAHLKAAAFRHYICAMFQ